MKKIISTVAALAVVAAMGATALAADLPSVTTTADLTVEPVSLDSEYYEITASTVDTALPAYVEEALIGTVTEAAGDAEVAAISLTELTLTNKTSGEDVSWSVDVDNPITVAIAYDDAQNVIAILTWDFDSQDWIEADFELDGDKIIATLENIYSPITLVTKAVKADEPSKDDGKGSAQTGYSTVVYVAAAVALAAGAAFFFATSGKKTAKDAK